MKAKKKKTLTKKKKAVSQKRTSSMDMLNLGKDIWPIERDVFFRPGRLKYVRKLIKKEGCVFCRAPHDDKEIEQDLCVLKTQHSQIVVNKFPYNSGHLLILPLRHCANLLDLEQAEYVDLMRTLKIAVQAITDVYHPQGYNMGLNNGSAAGAGIPDHLHFHIVPRWNGDLNFFPLIAETKLVIENVEDTVAHLKKYFQDYKTKGDL